MNKGDIQKNDQFYRCTIRCRRLNYFLNNNKFYTFIKNKTYEKTIIATTLTKFYNKSTRD